MVMSNSTQKSQTNSNAGGTAIWFLTVFILIWDSMVFGFVVPARNMPFWFKSIFVGMGLLVTVATVFAWRNRIIGGSAKLQLSADPVPHGTYVNAKFKLAKPIEASLWSVEAVLATKGDDHYHVVWSQTFAAQKIDTLQIEAKFAYPIDHSPKYSEYNAKLTHELTLKADSIRWQFELNARDATEKEMLFEWLDLTTLGSNQPTFTPATIEKWKGRVGILKFVVPCLFVLFFVYQIASIFDFNLISRAKAQVGLGAYSSQVSTEEFDVRVTNSLQYHRSLRVRLVGKGRVVNGEFRVRVDELDIQPNSACRERAKSCEVASVTLLLSQDGDGNFSTQVKSAPLDVNLQLQDITHWSLPAERVGTELVMKLPPSVDVDTMRLKLEIRAADGSTVYPEGGPYLALHRALAKVAGQKDPCEKISSKLSLVKAGCDQQLQASHGKPSGLISSISALGQRAWFATRQFAAKLGLGSAPKADEEALDNLLLEALMNENFASANALLAMGANPNTEDTYQVGRTVLGYAAASKDMAMVDRLLQAGAKADASKRNELGQFLSPLTQAIRADAANTVAQLISAGASVRTDDPSGWTPMHIAAYESSKLSLAVLVKAGGDVNERTPAYRQQNVLQTALQFGDIETVSTLLKLGADPLFKDNKGENACGWAKFFKRNEKIQAMVCP
jgi:Ankyrin repeats (3 copies)